MSLQIEASQIVHYEMPVSYFVTAGGGIHKIAHQAPKPHGQSTYRTVEKWQRNVRKGELADLDEAP